MSLLYEELTYLLRSCAFDIHTALVRGHNEESYHLATEHRLKEAGIPFHSKAVGYIKHRGKKVYKLEADLIINDEIVLELKNLQDDFLPINFLQILCYLKCWRKELGLLVNFGLPSVKFKRVPFTERNQAVEENYDSIKHLINKDNRHYLLELREAILNSLVLNGLGYSEPIYKAILKEELTHCKIPFSGKTLIPVKYSGQVIKRYEMDYPIINNQIICGISAVKEDFSYDKAKLKTYLKALNLPIGIIAHFGKKKLELIGIKP